MLPKRQNNALQKIGETFAFAFDFSRKHQNT
jgi:hypothetical protein